MFSLGVSSGLVPSYCNSYKYIICKSWHHWNSTSLVWILSHWWSNGSCTELRLPGRHLGMEERTLPTAQPGKDWASCLPCHLNSTAWLHDSVRFINNYLIKFSQKSWCNLWWPADLQRAHCKDCLILQVCTTQHQKDPDRSVHPLARPPPAPKEFMFTISKPVLWELFYLNSFSFLLQQVTLESGLF